MRIKFFGLALSTFLFALCFPAEAQQPAKVPRIGYLSPTGDSNTPGSRTEAFRQGLRDLGYIEGKNILVEYRYAEGKPDRIPSLAAELVQLKVDVLISPSVAGIRAAKQATKTTPIVMVIMADPVATGLIVSLARPGGNVTGLTRLTRELSGKRLELLKEVVPKLSRVGILGDGNSIDAKVYETAARAMKIQFLYLEVRGPNPDFDSAFEAAAKGNVSALVTASGTLVLSNRNQIAEPAQWRDGPQNGRSTYCGQSS